MQTTPPIITIERARIDDAATISTIIGGYAGEGKMLPRSPEQVATSIRDFHVSRVDGVLAGCVALHVDLEHLAELRSLAVADAYRNHGLGRRLVDAALADARALGVPRIYTLTYIPDFFEKFGFHQVDKSTLPQKVWADCVHCQHFYDCDEIALLKELPEETA